MTPARYSLSWALSVVYRLKEKYARATELAEENLEISDKDLAKFLAIGDPVFPQIRELVHIYDNYLKVSHLDFSTTQELSEMAYYLRRKGWERLAGRLDSVSKRRRLEEQGSRGGVERGEAE